MTLEEIFAQAFGPENLQAFLDLLPQPGNEQQLISQAQQRYNPYFNQLLSDAQGQNTLTQNRLGEDLATYNQQQGILEPQRQQQDIGNANDRFGEAFGSPLAQQILMQQQQLRNIDAETQRRNFSRQQFDAGDLLRRRELDINQNKQEAIGNYVAGNVFQPFTA